MCHCHLLSDLKVLYYALFRLFFNKLLTTYQNIYRKHDKILYIYFLLTLKSANSFKTGYKQCRHSWEGDRMGKRNSISDFFMKKRHFNVVKTSKEFSLAYYRTFKRTFQTQLCWVSKGQCSLSYLPQSPCVTSNTLIRNIDLTSVNVISLSLAKWLPAKHQQDIFAETTLSPQNAHFTLDLSRSWKWLKLAFLRGKLRIFLKNSAAAAALGFNVLFCPKKKSGLN